MARARCSVRTGAISLAANVTKTLIQLQALTNQGVGWLRAAISFQGVTVADPPVLISIVKQTDAGTMSAYTEILVTGPGASITPQSVAQTNATVEPTTTDVVSEKYVHPQMGYEYLWQPWLDEIAYVNARYGLRVVTATSGFSTCNCVAELVWEE